MSTSRIRVLCVDDHRIVREGIALIIERQPDMEVVGSAATGEESVELFRRRRPDVTLMDLQLGQMSGVQAIRAIRQEDPQARIIALTMYQGDEDIHRALEAGAIAYLLKDSLSDDLIRIVREVHAGQQPDFTAEIKARLAERAARPTLTPREQQVVELISLGMRNKEIAAALGISEETAQVHVKNILAKLDAKDRTAAVNVALRRGIIHIR
jgi:two-component system NarL family response regulator